MKESKQDINLENYMGWLRKVASNMKSPSDPDFEDLVQEGLIAMWQALESYEEERGALPAWITFKARTRMISVVTGRPWTGQPPRREGRYPVSEPDTISLDAPQDNGSTIAGYLEAPDVFESHDLSYHDGEIAAAINHLTPAQREYVVNRFWRDLPQSNGAWYGHGGTSKRGGIKSKLARDLAHLAA